MKYSISLSNGRKLILTTGNSWRENYLKTIVVPLLHGSVPDGVKTISSSLNSDCWEAEQEDSLLFIKFFRFRGVLDKLFMIRKSRSERAWKGGALLQKRGFLTPELIAQGDIIHLLKTEKTFLITKGLKKGLDLYSYINTFFSTHQKEESIKLKRNFITASGRIIGKLHKTGIFHGDLRPGNILIQVSGNTPLFYFIDNERNRYFPNGIPERLRMKNLVQINMIVMPQITFSDRLRFFRAYLSENQELQQDEKLWMRNVFMKTRERLQDKLPGIWIRS